MSKLQGALIGGARAILSQVPGSWLPGSTPDPLIDKRVTLGTQQPRVDGPDKVRGAARFAAEVPMEGLLHASFVHSTIARGRIASIDITMAESAPGVALVMTHLNAPRMATPRPLGFVDPKAAGNHTLPVMQDAQIHWNGQCVAVVLAETREQADHAAGLLCVTYEEAPARLSFADGKADAVTPEMLTIDRNRVEKGDAQALLRKATHTVDAIYSTPWENHNPIEPHAATIVWEAGDRLVVHDATQMLHAEAGSLARVFGLKADQVIVHSPYVGGGFGSKALWDHQILGAAAAKLAGRAVRVRLSRESMHRLVGGRAQTQQRVALGCDARGQLTALLHHGHASRPAHSVADEGFSQTGRNIYAAHSFDIVQHNVQLDLLANTYMRAPGEAPGTFAIESAMDELAHAAGMDPVEMRRINAARKNPITGAAHTQSDIMAAYAMGAEKFGWDQRKPQPRSTREGEWWIGMGCASGTFPFVRMPGTKVRLTVSEDGRALVESAAHEMGMGTATVQRQHTADRLGLALDDVDVKIGSSDLPFGGIAGGSSQTASLGAAIGSATDRLAKELLRMAGNDTPLAGLKPSTVEFADGGLRSLADPSRGESFSSILSRANRQSIAVTGESGTPLEMLKYSMHSTSSVFCEVRVSDVTGEVRVSRLTGAFDCGRILNPRTAASQFRGGMIMGLGMALTEEALIDERTGRLMTTSLAEYHIPVHLDVPDIDVLWTDIPDPRAPMGARGIGEIGTAGVAAAVANAVFNATGVRVRDLPITLDKVLAHLPR